MKPLMMPCPGCDGRGEDGVGNPCWDCSREGEVELDRIVPLADGIVSVSHVVKKLNEVIRKLNALIAERQGFDE